MARTEDPGSPIEAGDRVIAEFGEQWGRFDATGHDGPSGYFGSAEYFADLLGPLLGPGDLAGRRVVEIGSGNGRIVNLLLDAGAGHVTAVALM